MCRNIEWVKREGIFLLCQDKIWDLVLSIVERYLIQCPFLGVSVKRDSTVLLVPSIFHLVPLEHHYKNLAHIANFDSFNKNQIGLVFQVLITKGVGIKNGVQRGWFYWAKADIYVCNLHM